MNGSSPAQPGLRPSQPTGGPGEALLLDLRGLELIHRTARVDTARARALLPYAGWCAFATALNMAIAKRNAS
ncbi:tryptophan-rich sensory protein [Streptomyces sp. AcE210]|uniref:tryptophan-rich sensory protein n=1 Tax=Streptomyces sp. AcE210 TaxID=2292703 RepID=UPI001F0B9884|nr:tryptophan-rich sensory protein [Streptomyces sp. AcE210]